MRSLKFISLSEGAHQRVYQANRSDRKQCVKGGGDSSARVCSEIPTSPVVSAPPAGTSSGSSSFRHSNTRFHISLASLLWWKKKHKKSKSSVAKKKTSKLKFLDAFL